MKAICLISGGIDSIVATQIAILNGFHPLLLHYHNYPFHSLGTIEKVISLSNMIAERNPELSVSLTIIPHGKTQEVLLNNLEGRNLRQTCLFCRIQMFHKAEVFAQQTEAKVIVTGEILGEQASQTLDNLPLVSSKVKIPVLRPLIGYNKEEVVQLSKKWGFYTTSILPGGCCSINPKYPETKGRVDVVEQIYTDMSGQINVATQSELGNIQTYSLPLNIEAIQSDIEI